MRFVDANIFLWYLTNDDPVKARKCLALFRKAKASEIVLTTSESVIAEVVYVLSSKRVYNLGRKEVGDNASMFPMVKSNYLDRGLWL